MLVKAIHAGLGQIILLGDALTRPRPQQRSAQGQATVNAEAAQLSLYQFHACPFCVKTRRAMRRLNVPITLHDAKRDPEARARLLAGGGRRCRACASTTRKARAGCTNPMTSSPISNNASPAWPDGSSQA